MPFADPDLLLEQAENLLLRREPTRAAALVRLVLGSYPAHARALHIAGLAAASAGQSRIATEYLCETVRLEPSARALTDLALVLYSIDRLSEAEACCQRALDLNGSYALTLDVLARIEVRRGRDHRACGYLRALAALRPDDRRVLERLSLAEYAVGNIPEAIRLMRRLIDGDVGPQLHSEYVSAHLYDPCQTGESICRAACEWAKRQCILQPPLQVPTARLLSCRKLRIGYVGGEFATTPSRYFVLPLLRLHDRRQFEITCYHTRHRNDVHTEEFRSSADRWRDCAALEDGEIFACIQADEIDILVDISGHLRHHRLSVFGLHPAPVQIAYPNYLGTTGMPTIAYIFTDRWVCPPGAESQYSEQPYLLSSGYLVYQPPLEAPPITALPCDSEGTLTFGLFQWPGKLNKEVWDLVASVLRACPESRLLFHYSTAELDEPDSLARTSVETELTSRHVSSDRVLFRGSVSKDDYLALLGSVDIALDTFPFNGVTTTCECLLMGVPVVTLAGSTHSGRIGYEILDRVGLIDFVASNSEQYVETATDLARDRDRLRVLRHRLRSMLRQSSLCNAIPLVNEIENAYRSVWQLFVETYQ
jgi:predicted O-linked N-acetylglucosamine transferase (SPINDLY family)